MNFLTNIEGLDEAIKRIEDRIADEENLKRAVGKGCAIVERAAKENAPKGSGDLRRSITSVVEVEGDDVVGYVFTPLEYAPYVEYGTGLFAEGGNGRKDVPWCYYDEEKNEFIYTSGMKPHPYLRPALNENRERIIRIIGKEIAND